MKSRTKILFSLLFFIAAVLVAAAFYVSTTEYKWGIKIDSVRLSAGGYMLDFRYRVLDARKAMPLFDGKVSPHLVDLKTGAKFMVASPPKIGTLRPTSRGAPPKEDRGYFIMFGNPWQYVKAGNPIAVVIGDFRSDEIIVQ